MEHAARYAIVTPYYREERDLLWRCLDSVKGQTIAVDHFMIADGVAQSWIDGEAVRHIKLDRAHGDYGNTPRCIGAMLAISEGYDGIGFLDADNWLDRNHVEACLAAASTCDGGLSHCDYVIAQRRLCRPDQTIMPLTDDPELIDTNCIFFLRGAFTALPIWAMMPKPLATVGDRVVYAMLRKQPFTFAEVDTPTVNYLCMWEYCYRVLGETPPNGARPDLDRAGVVAWASTLGPREFEIVNRLTGQFISRG